MTTDPISEYLATSKKAALQMAEGAEVLKAAVHHRWSVKTGADPDAENLAGQAPTVTTLADLCALAVPAVLPPDGRSQGAEETLWQLTATLTGYKHESDGDYHLVIADNQGNTMIAEIPDPAALAPGSFFAQQIADARHAFDDQFGIEPMAAPLFGPVAPALVAAKELVTLQGLGFFDFNHGQDGVAPNAIGLHPVISIEFQGRHLSHSYRNSITNKVRRSGQTMSRMRKSLIAVEAALAGFAGILAIISIFQRYWIEILLQWDPDHHNGSAELLTIVSLASLSLLLG